MIVQGTYKPVIDSTYLLNEAAEAIFMSRPTLKGLLSNIDNTARKVRVKDYVARYTNPDLFA